MNSNDHIENSNNLPSHFLLFLFGSKSIERLSECLTVSENDVYSAATAHTVKGYERIFFSDSRTWNGSVATIEKTGNSNTNGIAVSIKKQNGFHIGNSSIDFQALERSEAFPHKYYLQKVDMIGLLPVYAFVRNPCYVFHETKPVTHDYLKAICRTLRNRRKLLGLSLVPNYEIDVSYLTPNNSIVRCSTVIIRYDQI